MGVLEQSKEEVIVQVSFNVNMIIKLTVHWISVQDTEANLFISLGTVRVYNPVL